MRLKPQLRDSTAPGVTEPSCGAPKFPGNQAARQEPPQRKHPDSPGWLVLHNEVRFSGGAMPQPLHNPTLPQRER